VAFTYNDPVVFLEYAVDVARACRARGVRTVAVTAGNVDPEPRAELFAHMDAANIDLKGFTDAFYHRICAGELQPVLDTLEYVRTQTTVWLEITTLLIPGLNDGDDELSALSRWVIDRLGPDVPIHFTAFHPDWKLLDRPPTPPATLRRARRIAMAAGARYVYTGNVRDLDGGTTYCHACGAALIVRDGYDIRTWALDAQGCCPHCGTVCAGVFEATPGDWGARRQAVRMSE
jgi:pyruvate formate lyase activating enzyme